MVTSSVESALVRHLLTLLEELSDGHGYQITLQYYDSFKANYSKAMTIKMREEKGRSEGGI